MTTCCHTLLHCLLQCRQIVLIRSPSLQHVARDNRFGMLFNYIVLTTQMGLHKECSPGKIPGSSVSARSAHQLRQSALGEMGPCLVCSQRQRRRQVQYLRRTL